MNLYYILIITVLTALSGFSGSSKTCPLNAVAEGFRILSVRSIIQYCARIRDTNFPQKIPVVPCTCALSLKGADSIFWPKICFEYNQSGHEVDKRPPRFSKWKITKNFLATKY